jgi:putative transposase
VIRFNIASKLSSCSGTEAGVCGAISHVLSRGNYRKELFDDGSARLFEETLFEVRLVLLHAYVIMSNHYHLAVETPDG